ncbi:MAG: ribonuclease HI family protein [bacterium]
MKTKGEIIVYSDGASRGNPGPSGAGAYIEDAQGNTIREISMFLGNLTNNQAEYQALILVLKEVASMRPEHVTIRMDSELIVKQIKGEYKIKNEKLIPLASIVKQQLMLLNSWKIEHVRREKNTKADQLANKAIDS